MKKFSIIFLLFIIISCSTSRGIEIKINNKTIQDNSEITFQIISHSKKNIALCFLKSENFFDENNLNIEGLIINSRNEYGNVVIREGSEINFEEYNLNDLDLKSKYQNLYSLKNAILLKAGEIKKYKFKFTTQYKNITFYKHSGEQYFIQIMYKDQYKMWPCRDTLNLKLGEKGYEIYDDSIISNKVPLILN